jgi:hypothetical protein
MDASGCACNVTAIVGAWRQAAPRGDAMPVAATLHAGAPARSALVRTKEVAHVHRPRMAAVASVASAPAF